MSLLCISQLSAALQSDSLNIRITDQQGHLLREALVYDQDYMVLAKANDRGVYRLAKTYRELDTVVVTSFGYSTRSFSYATLLEKENHEIRLAYLSDQLEEILVVGRFDQDESQQSHIVQSIEGAEFTSTQSATTADALEQHSDVFVQKSQFGGGSPVVRGFEASRVLLVVDGVRMNNLIYRSGHLQNALTIDPSALSRMEVIYGPGSLLYGSDALGGVIHFRTQDPILRFANRKKVSGTASLRYASAASALTSHVDLNVGGEKVAYFGSVTFADFNDLKSGSSVIEKYPAFGLRQYYIDPDPTGDKIVRNKDDFLQVGTAYRQFDMIHKLKWQPTKQFAQTFNLQYSTTSDIPRYDQLSAFGESPMDLTFAEWNYGPQDRFMLSSKSVISNSSLFSKGVIIAALQRINESRISRRTGNQDQLNQLEEVTVLSLTADFQKASANEKTTFYYGLDLNYNNLVSTAFSRDISTEADKPTLTRYPNDLADMNSWGVYLNTRRQLSTNWSANLGARFSQIQTNLRYDQVGLIEWPASFVQGVKNRNANLTWAGSLNYDDLEAWTIRFLVGSAFRAPNIDDLAKIRVKGGEASVPNIELKPERATNLELTIGRRVDEGSQISVSGFYTHLQDAIVQTPFPLPDGQTELMFDGELFTTVANINAERGNLYGLSFNLSWQLTEMWNLVSSFNYIKGTTLDKDEQEKPMAHIPPIYGRTSLSFEAEKLEVRAVLRYNGPKKITLYSDNSADNIEFATPEGTLAWVTFNLYGSYDLPRGFDVQVALENIADTHYRPFASGVSAPGRNVSISLRWLF